MKYKLGLKPVVAQPRIQLCSYYTGDLPAVDSLKFPLGHAAAIQPEMFMNDQLGDCIAPDTKVLTASLEWVTAGSLQPGDKLLGFDELPPDRNNNGRNGRRFTECEVERADVVIRPCYKLTFEDGTEVIASSGHRWLVSSTVQGELKCQRWERTEDLRSEAPRQTRIIKPLETWETDHSWSAGYLAGAFDGEGNIVTSISNCVERTRVIGGISFAQTDNEMLHQTELALKECGFEITWKKSRRHNIPRVDGSPRKDITNLTVGGKGQFLRFMGSIRPRRLLAKMNGSYGVIPGQSVALVGKEFIGDRPVVMLDTSSRTYFANGLASHNCAIAGSIEEVRLANALRGVTVNFTDNTAVQNYSEIAGYNGDPSTDNGTDVHDLYEYRKATGIVDADGNRHKIVAYAGLTPGDFDELLVALSLFDMVGIGIQVLDYCDKQFDAGQPWHIVRGFHRVEGGHYVPVCGAQDKDVAQLYTWGGTGGITRPFYTRYNTVAVVALTEELFTGDKSPEGIDRVKLAAELNLFNTGPVMAKAPKSADELAREIIR